MKSLTARQREGLVTAGHSQGEDYVQRCERRVWTYILLYKLDTVVFEGRTRRLMGKSIGAGVWEITKAPLTAGTP